MVRTSPGQHAPCVMDLISMVLGMRSSEAGCCTDFRLILDLKSVLIKVDFPRPLCPGERTGCRRGSRQLRRGKLDLTLGLWTPPQVPFHPHPPCCGGPEGEQVSHSLSGPCFHW